MKELTEKFVRGLREEKTWHFWNIFSILENSNPNFLDSIVEEYKEAQKQEYKDDWFRIFHKWLRQVDYF